MGFPCSTFLSRLRKYCNHIYFILPKRLESSLTPIFSICLAFALLWVSQLGLLINQARWPAAANSNSWYHRGSVFLASLMAKGLLLTFPNGESLGSFSMNYNFSTFQNYQKFT